jgi:hypothetical protein
LHCAVAPVLALALRSAVGLFGAPGLVGTVAVGAEPTGDGTAASGVLALAIPP